MNAKEQFLIDCIIDDIATYLINDKEMSIIEALDIVYNSQLYEKLFDLKTGLYYQSPAYNYELLKQELKFGKVA